VGSNTSTITSRRLSTGIVNLPISSSPIKALQRSQISGSPKSNNRPGQWSEVWSGQSIGKRQSYGTRNRNTTSRSTSSRARWCIGRCFNGICQIQNIPGRSVLQTKFYTPPLSLSPTMNFQGMNEHAIYDIVGAKRQRPSTEGLKRQWRPELVDLMERMWAHDPAERPIMDDVVVELEEIFNRL